MNDYLIPQGPSIATSFLRSFEMVSQPIKVISENIKEYGDTYGVKTGINQSLIITQDPGFIEHVLKKNHKNYAKSAIATEKLGRFLGNGLLTSNGEYWLRQRRLIQPGFHRRQVQDLYGVMQKTINDFLQTFPTGKEVDVYPLINKLAFQVVIHTLFNVAMKESTIDELATIISEVQEYIVQELRQPYKYLWFVLSGKTRHNLNKSGRARRIIRELVRERKESCNKANDLLDMLLDARYEDTGEPMNEEQLIDEILILIVAGHETSANALAWSLYLLANHPGELESLRSSTKGLGIEETIGHPHLAAVIKETLRLYPPAWISDRVAVTDDRYGEYFFPKGTIVVLFLYGIHHHPAFWQSPEIFIPGRFADESTERVVGDKYYPFGAGPRFCIGSGFAMAEMALFLKSFIHKFQLKPTFRQPEMIPLITLRPDKVVLDIETLSV